MKPWQEQLIGLQDLPYREFTSRLIPNIDKNSMIGIRLPALRKFAKAFAKTPQAAEFMAELPHTYYEENLLHMLLIAQMKDYDAAIAALEIFLPYVDNWAVCDVPAPKCFGAHRSELLTPICTWLSSGETYTVRYGIGLLMRFYLDDPADAGLMELVADVKSEEYYVNMMIAWYFATALAMQWETAVSYLQENRLEVRVHNKTIQKARESYRITAEQKSYLKTLRRKN